jgi:hypothetical protein
MGRRFTTGFAVYFAADASDPSTSSGANTHLWGRSSSAPSF